ncbi:MAG: GlcG/HbpS family heme-binding protein [Thiobacillus sp.]
MKKLLPLALLAATLPAMAAQPDILPVKQIGLELARDIAMASIDACRQDGYNVAAVVLDRAGNLQVALRDSLAARHTLEIAERKAGMAIMSGVDSGEFRAACAAAALRKLEERLEFAL